MNNRTLSIVTISALAASTITALVFLILFIVAQSQLHSAKKHADSLQAQISKTRNDQAFSEQRPPGVPERHTFISHLDGSHDEMAILTPQAFQGQKDLTLVVYLHGMGSGYMEPFLAPKDKTIGQALAEHNSALVIASLSYRGQSAWGNDVAVADISQNIHELLDRYPISKIVIMGTSMGGCSALSYSYLAPDDIKAKIIGVVAAEPAGDLTLLYEKTKSQIVKSGMIGAFGGPPNMQPQPYISRSLLNNTDKVPPSLRFAIISARQDGVIKPDFQQAIINALKDKKIGCQLIEVDEQHGIPQASNYVSGLDFVVLGNAIK